MFGNVFSWVKEVNEDVAQKDKLYDLSSSAADKAIFFRLGPSCRRLGFHTMIQKKRELFHIHRIHYASFEWISKPTAIAASVVNFF